MIRQLSGTLGQLGVSRKPVSTPQTAWWLAGGIDSANVVAAYQAKGAASYADSKVNLGGNPTYNAREGAAPAWDALVGWTMNGNKWLETGILPTATMSAFVRFTNADINYGGTLLGSYSGNNTTRFQIMASSQGKKAYEHAGSYIGPLGSNYISGSMAITGQSGYYNGLFDATIPGTWSGSATKTIHIGHQNGFTSYCGAVIIVMSFYANPITAEQIMALHQATEIL